MKLLPGLIHAFARLRWYVLRPLTVGVRVLLILVCKDFALNGKRDNEIAAWSFFPVGELPLDISPGTRRRIEEYLRGDSSPPVGKW